MKPPQRCALRATVFWSILFVLYSASTAFSQIAFSLVGSTNDGGTAFSLVVSNDLAYVANGPDGLRVYDVSDPHSPKCIGHANENEYAYRVAVSGNYAYVSGLSDGLHIYDVSDHANPVHIGHATNSSGGPIAVRGHYVFTRSASANSMAVFDVTDPANPTQVAQGLQGYWSMAFSDNYLYITYPNSSHTIYGYDISDPSNPTNVYVSLGSYVFGLAVSGHYLFAGSQSYYPTTNTFSRAGLLAFDVSNPTHPVYIASSGGSGFGGGQIRISGPYAYCANIDAGLQAYDISNITGTNIAKVGEIKDGRFYDVAVSGSYAYAAHYLDGLRIYAIEPQLDVRLTDTNAITFSWPTIAPFTLQQTSDLGAANWSEVNQAPIVTGGKSQIILPNPTTNTFFRLVH